MPHNVYNTYEMTYELGMTCEMGRKDLFVLVAHLVRKHTFEVLIVVQV